MRKLNYKQTIHTLHYLGQKGSKQVSVVSLQNYQTRVKKPSRIAALVVYNCSNMKLSVLHAFEKEKQDIHKLCLFSLTSLRKPEAFLLHHSSARQQRKSNNFVLQFAYLHSSKIHIFCNQWRTKADNYTICPEALCHLHANFTWLPKNSQWGNVHYTAIFYWEYK